MNSQELNWEQEYQELADNYERLLENLPQGLYSKAGTPPLSVVKAVEENIYNKHIVRNDLRDILESESTHEELLKEIRDYFKIKLL